MTYDSYLKLMIKSAEDIGGPQRISIRKGDGGTRACERSSGRHQKEKNGEKRKKKEQDSKKGGGDRMVDQVGA